MLKRRGFSLIELMIAVTIFAIAMMLALPSFTEWIQGQQIRVATEAILNGLQIARAEAIRRNLPVQIVFGPGTAWAVTEMTSGAAVQSRVAEEGSVNAVLTAVNAGPPAVAATTVTFTPLGSTMANADASPTVTRLDISNPTGGLCQALGGPMRCLAVQVSGGGSLKMCDPHPLVVAPDARACS
jgi:type IV fimbrial biogenesis protein FimT